MSRHDSHNPAPYFFGRMLLLLACLGCGVPATEPSISVESVALDHFTEKGVLWRKQGTLEPIDQKILTRFFETQPAWRDSIEVEGEPIAYASDDHRRFYWIRAAKEGAIWTCIHWEKKRFHTSSGAGELSLPAN